MPANRLSIPKTYKDGQDLFERDLDNIRNPIEAWASQTVLNLNQITLDAYGNTYNLSNTGNASLAAPLRDATTGIAALNWIFSGTFTLRTTDDTTVIIDANAADKDARIAFQEQGNTDWLLYNDGSDSDILKLRNDADNDVLSVTQAGLTTITGFGTTNGTLAINSQTDYDSGIQFQEAGNVDWYLYNDGSDSDILKLMNDADVNVLTLSQTYLMSLNSSGANDAELQLSAAVNQNPILSFYETTTPKWAIYNDNTTDELIIENLVDQTGELNLNAYASRSMGLMLNAGAGSVPYIKFKEWTGAAYDQKWDIRNDPTADTFQFRNASDAAVVSINQTGELSLPAVDPPTANYMTRQAVPKAWLEYIDNSGTWATSFNVSSVTDDDGDGNYFVYWDTDFSSANYVVTGSPVLSTVIIGCGSNTSQYGTIISYDPVGAALQDATFHITAFGEQ